MRLNTLSQIAQDANGSWDLNTGSVGSKAQALRPLSLHFLSLQHGVTA